MIEIGVEDRCGGWTESPRLLLEFQPGARGLRTGFCRCVCTNDAFVQLSLLSQIRPDDGQTVLSLYYLRFAEPGGPFLETCQTWRSRDLGSVGCRPVLDMDGSGLVLDLSEFRSEETPLRTSP